ncbi:MAG: hypothetical protein RLZZ272_1212 [Actinomycetota bacterium]
MRRSGTSGPSSTVEEPSAAEARAVRFAALGDPQRLAIVDALLLGDRTPTELQRDCGLASSLLAFHLDVLESAGLVSRHRSQGDGRRRYVVLRSDAFDGLLPAPAVPDGPVVFVCTRNAARSQLAAALWRRRTGRSARSAGRHPAVAADPLAMEVAAAHGLDPSGWRPVGYEAIDDVPALVVSVCDRTGEAGLPWSAPVLHWSVPDPAGGDRRAYEATVTELEHRVRRLALASAPSRVDGMADPA